MVNFTPSTDLQAHERKHTEKTLQELIDIIHFTETVSAKVHGSEDVVAIFQAVKAEFVKSKKYGMGIYLLTDDGKLRLAESTISPTIFTKISNVVGISLNSYTIDLDKSTFFSRVVKGGETIQANFGDIMSELLPSAVAYLVGKVTGLHNEGTLITPLYQQGKIMGALSMSHPTLAEYFIPSVKNLAKHISTALDLAHEKAKRRLAEAHLQSSEERYRSFFETSRDMVFITSKVGELLEVNDAGVKMLGYGSREELMKVRVPDLYANPKGRSEHLKRIDEQGFLLNHPVDMKRKNGTILHTLITTQAWKDEKGEIIGYQGIVKDITERKRAEMALRESGEKYRSLVERANDGIVIVQDGLVRFTNLPLAEMFGGTAEEIVGTPFTNYIHPDELPKVAERYKRRIAGEKVPPIYETVLRRKDGGKVDVELNAAAITYQGKPADLVYVRDTTERKQMEAKLKESEARYRLISENTSDYIAITTLDLNPTFKYASPSIEDFGYKPEDLLSKSVWTFIHPEDKKKMLPLLRKYVTAKIKKLLTGKEKKISEKIEYRFRRKSGEWRYLEGTTDIVKDSMIFIAKDSTERKRLEAELRASEERYRKQFEEALDAIFVADAETGILIDCNRAATELVGRKKSELIGKHQRILHPPEERKGELTRSFKQHLKEQEGQVLETQVITKKGEIREVAIKANPFELRGKKILQGIFRDITERKKTEEAVRLSEERYRNLVNNMYEGLYTIDAENRISYTNPRFAEMLGYQPKGLLGKEVFNYFPEEEVARVKEELGKRARGFSSRYELPWLSRAGERISTLISASPIIKEGKYVGSDVVVTDLSERKRLEEEKLETINIVARSIGHDIRSPLTAIRLAAQILKDVGDAKKQEMLDLIERNVVAADKILQELKDLTATPKIKPVKVDINLLLRNIIEQTIIPENIKLTANYTDLPPTKADADQLTRIFGNMLKNAIEAMPDGGELTTQTSREANNLTIKIKDIGIGIPQKNLEKIFTPFYTTKEKGAGLGLANAKQVIEAHRGKIILESEEDKGTTITVQLPITPTEKTE